MMTDLELELLYRPLSETRWVGLTATQFDDKFFDEVSDVWEPRETHEIPSGTAYVLPDGLVALEDARGKWSLYECESRARQRDHLKVHAEYARGHWSSKVPQKPGWYCVRDKDLGKRTVRELKLVDGRLKDVSPGAPPRPGRVTEWVGDWWVPAIPPLPGSF